MDFIRGLLGGGGSAPASSPGIGGSGKGASGAATIFGNNSVTGESNSPLLVIIAAVGGLALLGFIVVKLSK